MLFETHIRVLSVLNVTELEHIMTNRCNETQFQEIIIIVVKVERSQVSCRLTNIEKNSDGVGRKR
jgi:hypothetical protein